MRCMVNYLYRPLDSYWATDGIRDGRCHCDITQPPDECFSVLKPNVTRRGGFECETTCD